MRGGAWRHWNDKEGRGFVLEIPQKYLKAIQRSRICMISEVLFVKCHLDSPKIFLASNFNGTMQLIME